MREQILQKIQIALGEVSAVFMSSECKGTEIVMPSEKLAQVSEELANEIINLLPTNNKEE
jgi:hypothetical protein